MGNSKRKERLLIFFCIIGIIVPRVINILELHGPIVYYDEMGYWGHAANLSGLTWKSVSPSWYSYGYSLLLIPLFRITHNMSFLYRAAIIVNAFLGVIGFLLEIEILNHLCVGINKITQIIISFTASCYSAYIFQSQIAWSETLVYTWFLLVVLLFIKFSQNPSYGKIILLTMVICVFYIIHNRNIVSIIAYSIILLVMLNNKKISWKHILSVICLISLFFSCDSRIKIYLSYLISGQEKILSGNNAASVSVNVLNMLSSYSGWKELFFSFAGKLWYILSSTFLLAYWGVIFICRETIAAFNELKKRVVRNDIYVYIFLLLQICGTIAVATLAMITQDYTIGDSARLDILVYGRYSDMICGLMIAFGIYYILKIPKSKYEFCIGAILYVICSVLVCTKPINQFNNYFIYCNMPGILFARNLKAINYFEVISVSVSVVFIIFSFIAWLVFFEKERNGKKLFFLSGITILIIGFICIAQNAFNSFIAPSQKKYDLTQQICNILNEIEGYNIYFHGASFHKYNFRTQVVEGDFILNKEPPKNMNDFFLIYEAESPLEIIENLNNSYKYICKNGEYWLLGRGESLEYSLNSNGVRCYELRDDFSSLNPTDYKIIARRNDDKKTKEIIFDVDIQNLADDKMLLNDANCYLSYHIYDKNGNLILFDGDRYPIDYIIFDYEEIEVKVPVDKLIPFKEYNIEFDIIKDGEAWYATRGGNTATVPFSYDLDNLVLLEVGNYEIKANTIYELSNTLTNETCFEVEIKNLTDKDRLYNLNNCHLAYHIYDKDGNLILFDGDRYTINNVIVNTEKKLLGYLIKCGKVPICILSSLILWKMVSHGMVYLEGIRQRLLLKIKNNNAKWFKKLASRL